MAKQKATVVEHTFTEAERAKYAQAIASITECQLKAEGLAERIAGQLYIVNRLNLYRIDNYKSMGDWAVDKFGISKGTCSDAISTFDRFGSKDKAGTLDDKYVEYTFSTLIKMKKLTDDQIKAAGIDPTMSRAAVVKAIEALKALEDSEAKRPKLLEQLNTITAAFHKLVNDKQAVIDVITHAVPDFFAKDKKATAEELEKAISAVMAAITDYSNQTAKEPDAPEPDDNSTVENTVNSSKEEFKQAIRENRQELEDKLSGNKESSTVENEPAPEAPEAPEATEEPETPDFPELTLTDFMREDGTINKKAYLNAVWEATQELLNGADTLTVYRG